MNYFIFLLKNINPYIFFILKLFYIKINFNIEVDYILFK